MRNLRGVVRTLGALVAVSFVASAGIVACGSDDTVGGTGDGGADATTDSPADVRQDVINDHTVDVNDTGTDAKPDSTTDAAPDANDAGGPDARDSQGPDANDSGHDANDGGGLDAADAADAFDAADAADAFDAADAADAADSSDAASPLATYPDQVTAAFCQHLAQCCSAVTANPFNMAKCVSVETNSGGFQQSYVVEASGATSSGNLAYDANKAAACFADIAAISCTGTETAAHWIQTRTDCFAAMNGTLPVGSACKTSFECSPGNYCQSVSGNFQCAPIQPIGGSCAVESNYACTYQQNGLAPVARCDADSGTCQAPFANGSACKFDRDCASGACDLNVCVAVVSAPSAGLCTFLTSP